MRPIAQQLAEYQSYHTQRITKISHFIGIPFLIFAALIFLGWIHLAVPNLFEINFAWIAIISVLIYYYFLDVQLAALLTVILLLLGFISTFFSQPIVSEFGVISFIVCLIIGGVAQMVGHLHEKRKPAFIDNYRLTIIAPIYLMAEIMFDLGYRKDLQDEMMKYGDK